MWLPKAVCWKLWLERNNRIFREKECHPSKVAIKIKALLGEALDHKSSLRNTNQLDSEELLWLNALVLNAQQRPMVSVPSLASWVIRLEELEFLKW